MKELFLELFSAKTETAVLEIINNKPSVFKNNNWKHLGGIESNYGIIENQQSSPVAALIEKVTNSIDATLMKKCYEAGINPESKEAPKSMDEAVALFYPKNNWDIQSNRRKQAEEIQIIADGPTDDTAVIIYDNGEGQPPEMFEETFLSLMKGNKNKIPFVQGKYNMGGSGAIVFCGKNGYQLIASKRYNKIGDFGFTLVRQHPLTKEDKLTIKNTWYEYLVIDDKIPSFNIESLDLKLHNKTFTSGTIIKLYSYQFGKRYGFAQELNQHLTEYLFEPALPVLTKDTKERYPNNKVLETDLFGLKRRLEKEEKDYLQKTFVEEYTDDLFSGTKLIVTGYVFKNKIKDYSIAESKKIIRDRYFKNNMSVLFSMNGQVHGHYTTEFITKSLQFNLLKNYLLIHVDCTHLDYDFRKELFMASRDRLKGGQETKSLRDFIAKQLKKKGSALYELNQERRNSISFESGSTNELLKTFTKDIGMAPDLMRLLSQTFKLDFKTETSKNNNDKQKGSKKNTQEVSFSPQRFPSFFNLKGKGNKSAISLPLNGERQIQFATDVEDNYFHRTDDPGELEIALVSYSNNQAENGDQKGSTTEISEVFNIQKSSPRNGTIRIDFNTEGKEDLTVGDEIEIKVSLNGSGPSFDEILLVRIAEPQQKKEKLPKKEEDFENPGLPEYKLVYENKIEGFASWDEVSGLLSNEMDAKMVMYPLANGDQLEKIFINMDSNVLTRFKAKSKNINEEQKKAKETKYISTVYFHTLFLYTITKNRKFEIVKEDENGTTETKDISEYLQDIFDSYYTEFIINFGDKDLIESLGE
ncbi:hypothetical protein [Aquimarina muelleri]|uniref:Histidine kinase-, DNA gyrase B-, and HSP90-like ATPase n=1 Tax=Aquimarina muelleri TaxID=279356 RepID=A0A918JWE7_9FLAO|nr:hypothetical protein [Aquimarina muelleri]MCX2764599.1 hypothetical protein [Aquimarina muelleri]GGX19340.1 hypothetical protein GCM10007384_20880 [Aquimarina muelleri]